MGLFRLMDGVRSATLTYKVPERFKKVLVHNVCSRFKRDPFDVSKLIPFKSEADFSTTILRAVFSMTDFKFNFWFGNNNPDHPDFLDEVV